nr:PHD finger protein ALFIN-LIKE 2-like [Ipomoea batatas]
MASFPVEDIFKNISTSRSVVLYALTRDVDVSQCDLEKDNLCLYSHPDERWEVTLSVEDVLPEIPEPVLGINCARDEMEKRGWLWLVAMHTDSWLLAVVMKVILFAGAVEEITTRLVSIIFMESEDSLGRCSRKLDFSRPLLSTRRPAKPRKRGLILPTGSGDNPVPLTVDVSNQI